MSFFNQFKILTILSLLTIVSIPAIAHNVEISEEVAATFHIEPNHNPQVNQPTTAWFALTRRGGNIPRTNNAQPLLKPRLIPLDVEKFQEIPGAKITFPQAGTYELEINGTAKDNSFAPFKLTYTVNVVP